ncbi:MAG: ribosome-associated translation inhibitor RaiA [Deltaproteobacteria bacterium]|nr:ribosome-associated translation inhibitor RaiA [Deltaproteobacteria bacterium]
MQVLITFRHMDASDAIRSYVDSKLEHLKKHLIKPTEVHAILSVEKFRHQCEINLLEQNFKASAKEVTEDMYKSIDKAIDKLEVQLRKHKDKLQGHHKGHESLSEIAARAEEDYQRSIDNEG